MTSFKDFFKLKTEDYISSGRITQSGLEEFRQWTDEESQLPAVPEQMLVLFLAACDSCQESARRALGAYFRTKSASQEMFGTRDIDRPELSQNIEVMKMILLPARTDSNSAIIVCRLEDPTYSKYDIMSQMKTTCMLSDLMMLDRSPPDSLTSIVDLDKFTMWLLPRLSVSVLMKFSAYLQEGLPFKISSVHLINCNSVVKHIMRLLKFCMKSELIDKFSIHYKGFDRDDFFRNHIPARCMPSDYGGELPSMEKLQERSLQELRQAKSFFLEEEKLRQTTK